MMRVLVAAVLMSCGASAVSAQVRPGLNELNVNGHLTSYSGDDSETVIQMQARLGHFITSAVELGVHTSMIKIGSRSSVGEVGGFGALHLGAAGAMAVPYVGAQAGTGFGPATNNPFTFGAFGGLKYFLGQHGAISPEVFISRTSRGDLEWTALGLRIGVAVFFGGR
jgi:hypothetical protein